jgi:hypothetical protein
MESWPSDRLDTLTTFTGQTFLAKEVEMIFRCATKPDGKWKSELTKETGETIDDGVIDVDPEDSAGKFLGLHRDSGGLIFGTCGGDGTCSPDNPCTIEFKRRVKEGNAFFEYSYHGRFVAEGDNFVVKDGRYTKTQIHRELPGAHQGKAAAEPLTPEEGTWDAQKPIVL